MIKKFIMPLVYVSEWVFFLYVLLFVFIFNLIYIANMVFIDMPWEEPLTLTSSFIKSLLVVIGFGLLCFFYINYLPGTNGYKKFKELIWGMLFGFNTLTCLLWFVASFPFDLSKEERVLLFIAFFISGMLTFQIVKKSETI